VSDRPAICIVSREYPPDSAFGGIARISAMEAEAFAALGHTVHVLSLSTTGAAQHLVQRGVVVHRLPDPRVTAIDGQHVHAIAWAMTVARAYEELDAKVRFDVVQVQDYYAEGLHLPLRPETLRVARLHALSSVVWAADGRAVTPGMLGLAALEHAALTQADVVLAPTELIARRTLAAVPALPAERVELAPPLFDAAPYRTADKPRGERLRLLFLGRLEPLKGPELALRALAAALERGLDVQLTLVGREAVPGYRTGVLIPAMRDLGLGFDRVRFVGELDAEGVRRHLRHADAALLPSAFENAHTAALEAIASGVPAIVGPVNGLRGWLDREHGFLTGPDDPAAWPQAAAEALADPTFLAAAAARGAAHVARLCDPATLVAAQASRYAVALGHRPPVTPVTDALPSMAIVLLAHDQLAYTQVAVRSVLRATSGPFTVYVVDNASTDGTADWVRDLGDDRVRVLRSEENLGVSGGRNLGIRAARADGHALIAFLDNDVETHPGWNLPFLAELADHPEVGLVGERGVVLHFEAGGRREEPLYGGPVQACDMVIGFCMVLRAEAVAQIGGFDENLGLFWHDDDDYGLRAARLGWEVRHVPTGLVDHFEHRSSSLVEGIWSAPEVPSELSHRNQAHLAEREGFLRGLPGPLPGSRALAVLAFADELVETPELLAAFAARIGAEDPVTLVLWSGDEPAEGAAARLQAAVAARGFGDEVWAPDLMVLGSAAARAEQVGSSVDAVLSARPAEGAFAAPARFAGDQLGALETVLARRLRRLDTLATRAAA
jgi:glycosyltransferase involved in cell wall biosynthesis